MATNLKKTVVQAANRAAKRRAQRKQSYQDWVDAKVARVKKRQGRRTAITRIRQKGKQARKGFRSTTRDLKRRQRTRPTASDVIGAFTPTDIGFDEIVDFGGFGGEMSGFEIDETITQKTWFWPAVIGSVALVLILRKPKKKKKKDK
jgi:hypothetical protein